jgi:hypothetical protein
MPMNYPGFRNGGPFQTYLDALVSCPFAASTLCNVSLKKLILRATRISKINEF